MADGADNLRLLVADEEDLAVASALLQDAIIPGVDISFNRDDRQFILIANRFCWEQPALKDITSAGGKPVHERRLCAVRLSHVVSVQRQNWPDDPKEALFNLLALHQPDMAETAGTARWLQMDFSGGASLRLTVDKLDLIVADLDAGHPTSLYPQHDI
jgi:hypothetical protein